MLRIINFHACDPLIPAVLVPDKSIDQNQDDGQQKIKPFKKCPGAVFHLFNGP